MTSGELLVYNGTVHAASGVIPEGHVHIRDGLIQAVGAGTPQLAVDAINTIDARGHLILPGFIDIHVNGGGGHMAMEGTPEAIKAISSAHANYGTTTMLATTITSEVAVLKNVLEVVARLDRTTPNGADVLGVHLEGPFLNPEKAGAHKKDCILAPSVSVFEELLEASDGYLQVLSLAPEMPGAIELIKAAVSRGVTVGLAHSMANYETTVQAIEAGLSVCTHMFNSMPPLAHREPGPVGAFLSDPETYVELISDGFHVHPAVLDLTIRAKGANRVALVTDAVTPAGTGMDTFTIDGMELVVRGKSCFTPSGGLAGSALTMNEAVKVIATRTGHSLVDAVRMASATPAAAVGISDRKGSIGVGKDGDLVVATEDLQILATVVRGHQVFGE